MSELKSQTKLANTKSSIVEFDEDQITSKFPLLDIAQIAFVVNNKEIDPSVKAEKREVLLQHIKDNEMGPFYELVTSERLLPFKKTLLTELKLKNTKKIQEIDAEIDDAETKQDKTKTRRAFLKKSEYLCQIGYKREAAEALRQTYEKTVGMGYRIDLLLNLIRLGLFSLDHELVSANIAEARGLMKKDNDWGRKKSILDVYEGLHKMATGDFNAASTLFLEAVPTFGSYELISREDLLFYTVLTSVYSLSRSELRKKVMRCNEIQEQLTGGGDMGTLLIKYVEAFHKGKYDQFFVMLAQLESQRLKFDRFVAPVFKYYYDEMRKVSTKAKIGYAEFLLEAAISWGCIAPSFFPDWIGFGGATAIVVGSSGSYVAFYKFCRE